MAPPDSQMALAARLNTDIDFVAETRLPTERGTLIVRAYRDHRDGSEPVAIVAGDVSGGTAVPVRVHDECFTSEVLGSLKCDCRQQLNFAIEHIKQHGPGAVIYLRQEGRGIGLANKVAAYALQEDGHDTVDANRMLGLPDDSRRYDGAAAILEDLGIRSLGLMTNNPRKIEKLRDLGVQIVNRIPIVVPGSPHSISYLETKAARMGHLLNPLGSNGPID